MSSKIITTTSVTRLCFTTQHKTCKTKTKTRAYKTNTKTKTDFFLVSDRSCPKTDSLKPRLLVLSEWHTSSESSCSAANTVELRSIWSTTVYRSPTWRHGSTSVQPVDVFWSYRVIVSASMAAGLLPSLARRPGTLSRKISGIRTLPWTTSSACWKRFCSQCN